MERGLSEQITREALVQLGFDGTDQFVLTKPFKGAESLGAGERKSWLAFDVLATPPRAFLMQATKIADSTKRDTVTLPPIETVAELEQLCLALGIDLEM